MFQQSKILLSTIHNLAHDLEVKVSDVENVCLSYAAKFVKSLNFSILAWIYFIFCMIIEIGPEYYSALFPPYDLEIKVTDLEILC